MSTSAQVSFAVVIVHSVSPSCANSRVARVTVSPRLAPRATASSKVKKRGRFDLKLVRDWSLNLSGGGASVTLEGDGFEARGRCLVFGLGTAAVEAEFALRAEVATGVVGS